jgi:hypothetical protein
VDHQIARPLRVSVVDDRVRRFPYRPDAMITHHPDHLGIGLVGRLDPLPERISPREIRPGERFIDDGNSRSACAVAAVELPPSNQRNHQRPEVVRPDAERERTCAGDVGATCWMEASEERVATQRDQIRHAHRRDTRNLCDPLDERFSESNSRVTGILPAVEPEVDDHAVVDVEPEIDAADLDLTADAKKGGDHEQ